MDNQEGQPSQPEQNPAPQQSAPNQVPPAGGDKNVAMAVVAYFIFFIPLLTDAKNDPFVRFHVRQGLGFLLAWFVAIWVIGAMISWSLGSLLQLAISVLWIVGVVYAIQGKQEGAPLVGPIFEKLKV